MLSRDEVGMDILLLLFMLPLFFYLHPDSQDDFLYLLEHRKRVSCKSQSPGSACNFGPTWPSVRFHAIHLPKSGTKISGGKFESN